MDIEPSKETIRFGIMCDGTYVSRWQADTIINLLEHEGIECRLLIVNNGPSSSRRINHYIKSLMLKNRLWRGYLFWSKNKFKASIPIKLSSLLQDIPYIECRTLMKGKFSEYFADTDVAEIKNHELDFILRFAFGIIRGEILNAAKFGVWSFHHGDEQKYRGGPPGFWEIYKNDKVTGSILQRLTNKLDAGIVLKKGFLGTIHSYTKNRDQIYFESSRWAVQICVDIINGHAEYLKNKPSTTNAPIYFAPTDFQFMNFVSKCILRRIQYIFKKLTRVDYWNIGVANAPIKTYLEQDNHPPVVWFPRFRDRFLADPFAVTDGSKLHIFHEDFPYSERKGTIAYTCYENGKFSTPETVIKEAFHLSYPYVFKIGEDFFMIPESYEANKILLYKAAEFPFIWRIEHILINNFAGIDNTLFKHAGNWWMFTSDHNFGSSHNLNLFYSDNIFGEWQSHPQNPVKTDIRSARSAGTPFTHNGELYRPSMNYSEKGEGSITINKVIKITKLEYQEIKHNEVRPYENTLFSDKIHTLGEAGEHTVIDGCKEALTLTNIAFLKYSLGNITRSLKMKL